MMRHYHPNDPNDPTTGDEDDREIARAAELDRLRARVAELEEEGDALRAEVEALRAEVEPFTPAGRACC